ncbi:MAG: hypothetical protein CO094_09345 [Anaerolineae bacterium CG_4_9_14_3_um_filter_57_17]|nr:tetratricopeptide repeat protein [bacterium]NCT21179.1 tetratricopeptide repeat protein [bacterium]OIO86827.1 MAG: hypothetical protein AUK01_01710 [Anaerolineae bacterium CG2_30_57_67]PJB65636.1 MAG: hypothetical protein CO094_09345 [Anaerolineae bacterium CG_4_9_14_3_um_filter_57_17]
MKKLPRPAVLTIILLLLLSFFPLQGYHFLGAGEYEQAARFLPWRADLLEQAAIAAFDKQAYPDTVRLLEAARERGAISTQGALVLGEAHWQLGAQQQALETWETFTNGDQASAALFLRLSEAYQRLGQDSAVERTLIHGVDLFQNDVELRFSLALWWMSETPALARPELDAARSLDPKTDSRYAVAAAALNEALAVDDIAYQRVVCGRALAALGNWPLAERAFTRAAQANPNYAEAWAWLGEARQQNGSDLAWPALQRALTLAPTNAATLARAGLYWQRAGDSARALEAFTHAATLEPQSPTWQLALGEAYVQSGDLIAAYEHYRIAVALAPLDPEPWRALAVFCATNESYLRESGLPAALKAVSLAPDDWRNPDALGRVLLALGNAESARRMFVRAAELAPAEAAPQFHLGLLFFNAGDLAQARPHFEQAAALDPAGATGDAARRVLERYFP